MVVLVVEKILLVDQVPMEAEMVEQIHLEVLEVVILVVVAVAQVE